MKLDIDIIFVFIGIYPLFVFLFSREWFIQKNKFITIVILNVFLFLFSFIPVSIINGASLTLLRLPLQMLVLYRFMHFVFINIFGKEPQNTILMMEKGYWADAIFNILFWMFSGGLLMINVYLDK